MAQMSSTMSSVPSRLLLVEFYTLQLPIVNTFPMSYMQNRQFSSAVLRTLLCRRIPWSKSKAFFCEFTFSRLFCQLWLDLPNLLLALFDLSTVCTHLPCVKHYVGKYLYRISRIQLHVRNLRVIYVHTHLKNEKTGRSNKIPVLVQY